MAKLSKPMTDESQRIPPYDNIRNLFYQLAHVLDQRSAQYRKGTRYERVWQSDARVFVQATRRKMTLSEIARELKVTRQAVQAAIKRLRKLDIVNLEAIPGNRRDKCVIITPRGLAAQATAVRQIATMEAEIAEALAPMDLETFRKALHAVLEGMTRRVLAEDQKAAPALMPPE
jgi:DNA-binding MarR family transcriptional regulator